MSAPEAQSARAEEIGRFIVTSSYRPWQYWSWQRSASYDVADVRRGESTAPGVRPCPNRMALMGARVGDLFGSNSRLLTYQQHQTVTRATGAPPASFNSAGQQRHTRLRHPYCRTARHSAR